MDEASMLAAAEEWSYADMAGEMKLTTTKARKPDNGGEVSIETASLSIPQELGPLFWDVDFRRLRWQRDQEFIIGRVLAEGGFQHTRWLVETAGRGAIREWIVRRRGRGLSPRVLRFWEAVLGLPHRDVSRWIAEQMAYPWASRMSP